MNTLKIYSVIMIAFAALTISCSSDDDAPTAPVFLEENPIPALIADAGYSETSITDLASSAEVGYSFTPLVSGKINALMLSLPVANANTRVTLWDVDTQQAIQTIYVSVPTAATEVIKKITPIALVKNKKYALSFFNGKIYYLHSSPTSTSIPYPRTYGNIKIDDIVMVYTNGLQSFPTGDGLSSAYMGDVSMKFQQTL
jgi:hypothetical protein